MSTLCEPKVLPLENRNRVCCVHDRIPELGTVLGALCGFNEKEGVKGGFVGKLHMWEYYLVYTMQKIIW